MKQKNPTVLDKSSSLSLLDELTPHILAKSFIKNNTQNEAKAIHMHNTFIGLINLIILFYNLLNLIK